MAINFNQIKGMPDIPTLLKDPDFKAEYVALYNRAHRSKNGAAHYDRETTFVKRMWVEKAEFQKASPLSMAMALMQLAYSGLSVEPIAKALGYLFTQESGVVKFKPSPYGELALRIRSKIITSINGPTLVYKGDKIIVNSKTGVNHTMSFESDEIVGGFVTINRPDRTSEDKYFTMAQILSYKKKSKSPGGHSWTGGVDGQPTKGMIEAKILLHALDTYPLMDLGVMASEGAFDPLEAEAALADTYQKLAEGSENTPPLHDDDDQDDDMDQYTEAEEEAPATPAAPPATPAKPTLDVTDF